MGKDNNELGHDVQSEKSATTQIQANFALPLTTLRDIQHLNILEIAVQIIHALGK